MDSTTETSRTRRKATANGSASRSFYALAALVIVLVLASASSAYAQGGTTRYVYDDNGRLRAVIAPNGEANIYEYDAAGNFTAIRRNPANMLEVLDFSPREGAPGTQVTIIGTGFGVGVNAVAFNGTAAQIVSVNAPLVVVTVPSTATTGPISLTTPGGTATTVQPFTIRGISVTPASATVLSQRTVQFTATVVNAGAQNVVWSVDGIEGGSSTVGTITSEGLYTSPNLLRSQPGVVLRVRATSVNEASLFGEAVVMVRNPEFTVISYSPAVSVLNGTPPNLFTWVSVLNGSQVDVFTSLVSVQNGGAAILYSRPVSITTGPGITAISPNQAARGATTAITITGANLSGATSLTFLNAADGSVASGITASNINVNGSGSSLTADLNVSSGVSLGRYIVFVTTPGGISATIDMGVNIIEVIP